MIYQILYAYPTSSENITAKRFVTALKRGLTDLEINNNKQANFRNAYLPSEDIIM
jgi:hypothetical protein